MMMTITVKFFAELREQSGYSELTLEGYEAITVTQVWEAVCAGKPFSKQILTAVNQAYVTRDTRLHDGDEIAFFPPVTGG